MIFYIARKHHTLGIQLHYFPGKLAEIVRLLPYEALYANGELPAGSYIFTDHDRLSRAQNEKVCHLWDWLDATNSEIRRLNDPRRVLLRFDLLRRLHEVGINDFNVYRLNEWRRVSRFPVFIRRERGHQKPLTGLLNGRLALSEAVNRFGNATDKADLMIVEFGNEPFADGRYRKYGAFRVGDRYYVQHCFITKDWYGKFNEDILEADVLESREYSRRNPHASQLREIFEIAGIEYGRIDYGIMRNRIQVFEINTNPSILAMESVQRPNPLIDSSYFAKIHEEAMLPLAVVTGSASALPPELHDQKRLGISMDEVHARTLSECIRKKVSTSKEERKRWNYKLGRWLKCRSRLTV